MSWDKLRQLIEEHFSLEELRTLCFDLNVDYDSLSGEGKSAKARELIAKFRREARFSELLAYLTKARSNVSWNQLRLEDTPVFSAQEQPPKKGIDGFLGTSWRNWGDHPIIVTFAVIAAIVGIVAGMQQIMSTASSVPAALGSTVVSATPTPVLALPSPSASTLSTPVSDAVAPTTVNATSIEAPRLPAVAPLVTTTLAVAQFTNCPAVSSDLARQLGELSPNQNPPVRVREEPTEITDSQTAREHGKSIGADLMIWGRCDAELLTGNFEILSARGAPEVYEPTSVSIPSPIKHLFPQVAYALGLYLHRDYKSAAVSFESVAKTEELSEKLKATLYLMQGNALLFLGKDHYDDAATVFERAITHELTSASIHHNLGVAQTNIGWETGELDTPLATFTETLELSPTFLLAYVNQGQIWKMLGSRLGQVTYFDYAEAACNKAVNSPEPRISALAEICLADTQVIQHIFDPNLPPQLSAMKLQGLTTPDWAAPIFSLAAAHHAVWSHKRDDTFSRRKAVVLLKQYLKEASDDLHLERSRGDYEYARDIMLKELLREDR